MTTGFWLDTGPVTVTRTGPEGLGRARPSSKLSRMNNLESLRKYTTVVADTGDLEAIRAYRPQDATTNPSLLLKAAQMPQYRALVDEALRAADQGAGDRAGRTERFMDKLAINFGLEILKIIPGRVSTEVDATYSFDTEGTIAKARSLIGLYKQAGVERERILIKVGSTWEGIRAAEQLEREGIHCNMTLLFSFAQAVACAEAGRHPDLPLRGPDLRLLPEGEGGQGHPPGRGSRRRLGGAHLQPLQEVRLQDPGDGGQLPQGRPGGRAGGVRPADHQPRPARRARGARPGEIPRKLSPEVARTSPGERIHLDEKTFRFQHNEDAMANDKLADGIRRFNADARKLEKYAETLVSRAA